MEALTLQQRIVQSLILFGLTIAVILLPGVVIGIIVGFLQGFGLLETFSDYQHPLLTLISLPLAFLALWLWMHFNRLEWSFTKITWGQLGLVVWFFVLHLGIIFSLTLLISLFTNFNTEEIAEVNPVIASSDLARVILSFLAIGLVVPIFEEIVFRGFLFKQLCRYFHFVAATVASSLFFALLHITVEAGWQLNLLRVVVIFLLSYLICYIYHKTGNLWTAIMLHSLNNVWVLIGALF